MYLGFRLQWWTYALLAGVAYLGNALCADVDPALNLPPEFHLVAAPFAHLLSLAGMALADQRLFCGTVHMLSVGGAWHFEI